VGSPLFWFSQVRTDYTCETNIRSFSFRLSSAWEIMVHSSLPDRLSSKVRTIEEILSRDGLSIRSMKKAGSLELMQGVDASRDSSGARLFNLERLEDVNLLEHRQVRRIAPHETGFRYFLDGAQKTLPVWRVGAIPITASFTVVGILERDEHGESCLLPGSVDIRHAWLIPLQNPSPPVHRLIDHLQSLGEYVVDPITFRRQEAFTYEADASEFGRIVDRAYATAGLIRESMEQEAIIKWQSNPDRRYPAGWMVVDGRLQDNHDRCVGIVKSLLTQHVQGYEAELLYDLPQGYRTTAFRINPPQGDDAEYAEQQGRTNWYMRFWNAEGFDARHALIRIEAPHDVQEPEEIDDIASWVLAERLPRPTDDPRWPTLLYPIHFLERILKRQLASMTVGWPA